jgi:cation transport ATPase
VKFRLPGRRPAAETTPSAAADTAEQQVATVGKGRPTPKRSEAQGRRTGPVPPPPTTRKEAYRRMRDQQAAGRGSQREALARGDDSALPARDRGPVRRLVRDVVDTRRNIGSVFLFVAALIMVSLVVPSPAFKNYATMVWLVFFLAIILDSFLLGRRIKKVVTDRFPQHDQKMRSLVWYGISRSTMVRRWRFPKPAVAPNAEV